MSIAKHLLQGKSALKAVANLLDEIDFTPAEQHEAKVETIKTRRAHSKTQPRSPAKKKIGTAKLKTKPANSRNKTKSRRKP